MKKRKTFLGKYALELEAADQVVLIGRVYENMAARLTVMKNSVAAGLKGGSSVSGLVGGQGLRYLEYINSGKALNDNLYAKAIAYALAVGEARRHYCGFARLAGRVKRCCARSVFKPDRKVWLI